MTAPDQPGVRQLLAPLACIALLGAPCLGQQSATIAEVAPKNSYLLASADNWKEMRAAMNASPLGALWNDPATQEFIAEFMKSEAGQDESASGLAALMEWLEELNIDKEDLHEPSGPVGIALFVGPPAKPKDVASDEEPAEPLPTSHFVAIADFGDNGESTEKVLLAALDDMVADKKITLDQDAYSGVDIRHITMLDPKDEQPADEEGDDEFSLDEPSGPLDTTSLRTMHLARVDGVMLLSTDQERLELSIDKVNGKGEDGVADDATLKATLAQHGQPPHVWAAVLFNDDLRAILGRTLSGLSFLLPPGMDSSLVGEVLGFSDAKAISVGMRFDSDAGVMEQTVGALVPGKRGLLSLLEGSTGPFKPPAFAGAEVSSAMLFTVHFERVIDMVKEMANHLPADQRGQAISGVTTLEQTAGALFRSIGPEIYVVETLERPINAESQHTVVAIKVSQADAVTNFISQFAPMLQLTPRDFQGNQIFSAAGDAADSFSIGLGFGFAFLGPPTDVENALRMATNDAAPKLADEPRFKKAAAVLGNDGIIYSFADLRQTLEHTYWTLENQDKIWDAQMDAMDLDEETRKLFEEDRPKIPAWVAKLPPLATILEHLGDSVLELRSTSEGYRGRSIMLRPEKAE